MFRNIMIKLFNRNLIFYFFIILIFFSLRLININREFNGFFESATSHSILIAENYNKLGFLKTNFLPFLNIGTLLKGEELHFLVDYPPLLFIILNFHIRIFGDSELSIRLMALFFNFITFLLFIKLLKLYYPENKFVQKISVFIITILPIDVYYYRLAFTIPFTQPLFLLQLILYKYWINKNNNKKYLFLLAIIQFVNHWFYYDIVFLIIPLLLYHYFVYKKEFINLFWALIIPALLFTIVFILQIISVNSDLFFVMFNKGIFAINPTIKSDYSNHFYYYLRFITIFRTYFGIIICFLMFFFFISQIKIKNIYKNIMFVLFFYGILKIAVFPFYSYVHHFFFYNLSYSFCIGISFVLHEFYKKKKFFLYILIILISIESIYLLQNLYKHRGYKFAIRDSKKIKNYTNFNDIVLTNSEGGSDVSIYYSRRKTYKIDTLKKFNGIKNKIKENDNVKWKFLYFIKIDNEKNELFDNLLQNYVFEKKENIYIFFIN